MLEIERKFLVDLNHPDLVQFFATAQGIKISQGYLSDDPERIVRVRIYGEQAFLTVKGQQVGIAKPEFEYEVPLADAKILLKMCPTKIDKTRYCLPWQNGLTFEVDVFADFVMAEIELPSADTEVSLPQWVTTEVSEDPNYSNAQLAKHSKSKLSLR